MTPSELHTTERLAVELVDVGKQYRLGTVGTGTLSHDLNRLWARLRGRPDPYATVGEVNDRTTGGEADYVWSLRGVSARIAAGEVVGIIGANGAGKSTLLKLLCQVTAPSEGTIRLNGRIASLLEVGTGFHRELTGRENVFLNATLLGMTRAEVEAKLARIVEFAGVARYIDTPIKRYSTGMKVRLAFAVAAHLEPEILIVDEVLAVGDAAFQDKAIGKLRDIATGTDRTVLFVSHDMQAIARLCTRCIVLDRGHVTFDGGVAEGIRAYAALNFGKSAATPLAERGDRRGSQVVRFASVAFRDAAGDLVNHVQVGRALRVHLTLSCAPGATYSTYLGVGLRTRDGEQVTLLSGWAKAQTVDVTDAAEVAFEVARVVLPEGEYLVDLYAESGSVGNTVFDQVEAAAVLKVVGKDFFGSGQVVKHFRYRAYQDFDIRVA